MSEALPNLSPNASLAHDSDEKVPAYVLVMLIGDPELGGPSDHDRVLCSRFRSFKAQQAQVADEVPSADWTQNGH